MTVPEPGPVLAAAAIGEPELAAGPFEPDLDPVKPDPTPDFPAPTLTSDAVNAELRSLRRALRFRTWAGAAGIAAALGLPYASRGRADVPPASTRAPSLTPAPAADVAKAPAQASAPGPLVATSIDCEALRCKVIGIQTDKGENRILLGATHKGAASITLLDSAGRSRLAISVGLGPGREAPVVTLFDEDTRAVARLMDYMPKEPRPGVRSSGVLHVLSALGKSLVYPADLFEEISR